MKKWDLSKKDFFMFESLNNANITDYWRGLLYGLFICMIAVADIIFAGTTKWILALPIIFILFVTAMTYIYTFKLEKKFGINHGLFK